MIRRLHQFEDGLIAVLGVSLVLVAGGQIAMRLLFDSGLELAEPIMRALVLWLTMLGALVAARHNQHIAIDALAHWLPDTVRRVSRSLLLLFAAGMCAYLCMLAFDVVVMEADAGSASGIPPWLKLGIVPVAFGLMTARFVFAALRALGGSTEVGAT